MKLASMLNIPLFTISLGKLEFKPGLIPTLVTLILLYVLISLGQWQLDRAEFKDNIQKLINARTDLPHSDLGLLSGSIEERLFMPVTVNGTFDVDHQLLLDNRVVNHQAGYDVYTPLRRNDGTAILVSRGWVPLGRTRQDLPDIAFNHDSGNIRGILAKPPSAGLVLSDNANQYQQWPALAQFVDIQEIEENLGYPLYPMILILDKNNAVALHQEPIGLNMNSEKHLGYAFQWFGLATALFIIYLVVNTKRGNNNDRSS